MADSATVQQTQMMWVIGLLGVCFIIAQPIRALTEPVGNDPSNPAIKTSAIWPVFVWCWCWPLAFARVDDVKDNRRLHRAGIRFTWALGSLLCLLHIAVAFHLGHGWSHQAAWKHTQQVSGYGDGIYVNYAFALVWLADAVWLCVAFNSYFARPRWLNWSIHGFLAFVVFNAAVVFGGWVTRVLCASMFLFVVTLVGLGRRPKVKEMMKEIS